jgi:predicted AAA+ superfamily ATPase
MVERALAEPLRRAARQFRVVTLTGPRQSGKTTLCREVFAGLPYASLESPDIRAFALADPRAFLAQFPKGAILDEIQAAPSLLSYVQERVDVDRRRGQFVLTGSQQLALAASVSQSLAGRSAVLQLLPLGHEEVRAFPRPPRGLEATIVAGSYPEIHDRRVPSATWYASYVATYVERDVRTVINVGNLVTFQTFLRLVAGRAGQLLNLSSLGADAGVSQPTARAWLSVLEAGYLVFRLPPLHRNLGKRLTKSPKLYFYDTGLLAWLVGIRRPEDLTVHPLRGAIVENWVVSEIVKARVHRGLEPSLAFYRDQSGREVDLVLEEGARTVLVEVKSGKTIAADFFDGLEEVAAIVGSNPERVLVYGGDARQSRSNVTVLPWSEVAGHPWQGSRTARRA